MKSIILNKPLIQQMKIHHTNIINQDNTDNLKLRLGKIAIEVDFLLGTIEVRNTENRVCINTYENELVSIDLEAIKD